MVHVARSPGRLWYIYSPMARGWKQMDTCILERHKSMRLTKWQHTYITSVQQVSHRHIICTHFYLLVDLNVIYEGPLLSHKLQYRTLAGHIMLWSMRLYGLLSWVFLSENLYQQKGVAMKYLEHLELVSFSVELLKRNFNFYKVFLEIVTDLVKLKL